ncbi:MAG: peptidylprolyl isomerase, partial [Pseudomonadota bacterium]|nr:peptidylprolyl isomerase [Pseudomonadota bacterium]
GTMHLNELSQEMQQALATTKGGGVTEPFHSEAGIELIVRCDAAAPEVTTFKVPSRDEIEQQLFDEQMTVLARRYMRDLRRDADIETR